MKIELGDRVDLLDDFLKATKLKKTELRLDQLAELDRRFPSPRRNAPLAIR